MDAAKTGKLIAAVRSERGLTQRQLGELLHVSHTTVSKWERGGGFPDVSLIEPLAEALHVSVAELFHGERLPSAAAYEPLLKDVVRTSGTEIRRKEWRAAGITLGLLVLFVAALLLFWPKPIPPLQGTYQSGMVDGYVLQLTVDHRNHTFSQYIDNRLVNQGTWSAGEQNSFHLQGDRMDFWLVLTKENTVMLSIPGIRKGEPILLENLGHIPCYFDTDFEDTEIYQALLQQ